MELVAGHVAQPDVTTRGGVELSAAVHHPVVVDEQPLAGIDPDGRGELWAQHAVAEGPDGVVQPVDVVWCHVERAERPVEVADAAEAPVLVEPDDRASAAQADLAGVAPDVGDRQRGERLERVRLVGTQRLGDGETVHVGAHAADIGVDQAVEDVDSGRGVVEGVVDVGRLGHAGLGAQLCHTLGPHVVDAAIDGGLVDGADEVGELLGAGGVGAEAVDEHDAVVAQLAVCLELAGAAVAGIGPVDRWKAVGQLGLPGGGLPCGAAPAGRFVVGIGDEPVVAVDRAVAVRPRERQVAIADLGVGWRNV